VVECFNPSDEPADPLELTIATGWACQIDDPSLGLVLTDGHGQGSESWEELISEMSASTARSGKTWCWLRAAAAEMST
jgi:hypothetical protein